jgi:hypothetical protein
MNSGTLVPENTKQEIKDAMQRGELIRVFDSAQQFILSEFRSLYPQFKTSSHYSEFLGIQLQ